MNLIEIKALDNGAHRNQNGGLSTVPEGWAVVPEGMFCKNFPFGEVEVEATIYYRDKMVTDEDGQDEVIKEPYTVMTVTKWTPGVMPEPEPEAEPEPTQLDRVEAQATYTAMMTDTLLGV